MSYGSKQCVQTERRVRINTINEGGKVYDVYVDREKIKYIPYNGAAPKYEWNILRTYKEQVDPKNPPPGRAFIHRIRTNTYESIN